MKPFGAEQLLIIEAAVWLFEYGVSFVRDVSQLMIQRHTANGMIAPKVIHLGLCCINCLPIKGSFISGQRQKAFAGKALRDFMILITTCGLLAFFDFNDIVHSKRFWIMLLYNLKMFFQFHSAFEISDDE